MFKNINNFIEMICYTFKTLTKKDILKVIFISFFTSIIITLLETYTENANTSFVSILILIMQILDIFIKNGIFNIFIMHFEKEKYISFKDFYSNINKNILNYVIIVTVAPLTASFIVIFLNFILLSCGIGPFTALDEFISTMLIHWLLFHGYISLAKKDSINQKRDAHNWMFFALLRFVLTLIIPSIYIINNLLNIIFMLFTLTCVYESEKISKIKTSINCV